MTHTTLDRRTVLAKAALQDLTITELAARAGVHRITLSKNLHRDHPTEPTIRTVVGLARALETTVDELLAHGEAA